MAQREPMSDHDFMSQQFRRLCGLLPRKLIRGEVQAYLEASYKAGEEIFADCIKDGKKPTDGQFVAYIIKEALAPDLVERFGTTGLHAARVIARCAGLYASIRSSIYRLSGADERYVKRRLDEEIAFTKHHLIRTWIEALILASSEQNVPEGFIDLDRFFFPTAEGCGTFEAEFPEDWRSSFEDSITWGDLFQYTTMQLALRPGVAQEAWSQFSTELRLLLRHYRKAYPDEFGFTVNLNSTTQHAVNFKSGSETDCVFRWRSRLDKTDASDDS